MKPRASEKKRGPLKRFRKAENGVHEGQIPPFLKMGKTRPPAKNFRGKIPESEKVQIKGAPGPNFPGNSRRPKPPFGSRAPKGIWGGFCSPGFSFSFSLVPQIKGPPLETNKGFWPFSPTCPPVPQSRPASTN